jgi:hypothetical protein
MVLADAVRATGPIQYALATHAQRLTRPPQILGDGDPRVGNSHDYPVVLLIGLARSHTWLAGTTGSVPSFGIHDW